MDLQSISPRLTPTTFLPLCIPTTFSPLCTPSPEPVIHSVVKGGRVCKSYIIIVDNEKQFMKTNDDPEIIQNEIEGYNRLHSFLNMPERLQHSDISIYYKFIESKPLTLESYIKLANQLEHLHKSNMNNKILIKKKYAGKIPVNCEFEGSWLSTFKKMFLQAINRLEHLSEEWFEYMKYYDNLNTTIFDKHNNFCTVLHGDLNRGNFLDSEEGLFVFDATPFYGSIYYDLASLNCFGTDLPDEFYNTYFQKNNSFDEEDYIHYYPYLFLTAYQNNGNGSSLKKGLSCINKLLDRINVNVITFPSLIPHFSQTKPIMNVFILNGTFAPLHKGHLDAFSLAIKSIISDEDDDKDTENICYIVPSSDRFCKTKLKREAMSMKHRYEIIKLSIKDTSGMQLSLLPSQKYTDTIDHYYSVKIIQNMYPAANIYVVCGNDTFEFTQKKLPLFNVICTKRDIKHISSTLIRQSKDLTNEKSKFVCEDAYNYYLTNVLK